MAHQFEQINNWEVNECGTSVINHLIRKMKMFHVTCTTLYHSEASVRLIIYRFPFNKISCAAKKIRIRLAY